MKKIIISAIVCFAIILAFSLYKPIEKKLYVDNDYLAITLNGKTVNYFPEKGLYSVKVDCKNVVGKWLYDEWKLSVENIENEKEAFCAIDFVSIEKSNLNEYIMKLANEQNQGNGRVVLEKNTVTSDNENYGVSEMNYELVSGVSMIKEGNKYIGNDTTYNSKSKFKFSPPKNGYVEVCYEIPVSSRTSSNNLSFHKLNSPMYTMTTYYSSNELVKGCFNYGYVKTTDEIYVSTYFADGNSSLEFKISDYTTTESENYRYEGENPNNYILFNNELWRIVGVFDSKSHGLDNLKLTKIVRANSIGNFSFSHKNNSGNWSKSDLKFILNNYYITSQDGSNSGYCHSYSNLSVNCDFFGKGIKESFINMIKETKWFLGEIPIDNYNSADFFNLERQKIINRNYESYDFNKIALLYPSDLAYGVLNDSCERTTKLENYGTEECSGNNWIYRTLSIGSWLLNQFSDVTSSLNLTYAIGNFGGIMWDNDLYGKPIFPALYLNENVSRVGGDGSILNPYIIAMDEA